MKRAAVAALALLAGIAAACSSASTQCDCADPAITINIPSDIAASVSTVVVSGTACDGVQPTCSNQTNGCSQYRVLANNAGVCHVAITFATGSAFTADVTIAKGADCCTGFYAQPASAATVDVPGPDGGA